MTERFELNQVQRDELEQPFVLFGIQMITDETHEKCRLLDDAHVRKLSATEVALWYLAMRGHLKFTEKAKHPPRIPESVRRRKRV